MPNAKIKLVTFEERHEITYLLWASDRLMVISFSNCSWCN